MNNMLYDLNPLNALVDGNEKFRKYLIELFIETTPPILVDIHNGYIQNDMEALYANAHKIKPTIESMGITTMLPVIDSILSQAKTKRNSAELGDKVFLFCKTLEKTILQLQKNEL